MERKEKPAHAGFSFFRGALKVRGRRGSENARITFARRIEMVKQITLAGLDAVQAAAAHGVTPPTARKWLGRYLAGGVAALVDPSFRPAHSPRTIDASKALRIVALRQSGIHSHAP